VSAPNRQEVRQTPAEPTSVPAGAGALAAVALGFFIVMLDTTIVNVALPRIGTDLGGGVTLLQWVVDSYTLVFAAFLLSAGALCDLIGARRVYLAGLATFAVFSALCASAPTGGVLITARALQGLGAAALVPGSLALLAACYPDRAARARAIGIWGGVGGIAAAVGPVLGGALIAGIGWRAVFWVNLPVVALVGWLTLRYNPNPSPSHRRHLDLPGQALAVIALCCITYAVIEGSEHGWSSTRLAVLAAGAIAVLLFLTVEHRSSDPMLPLRLFRNRSFSVASTVGLALNLGFYGQFFVLTLYFQHYRGDQPFIAGLSLAPQALGAVIGSPLGGRATARLGATLTMLIGLLVGAAAFASLLTLTRHTPYPVIAPLIFAAGLGISLAMPAATAGAVSAAPAAYAGIAGGVVNSARQTGSIFGVALLGSFAAQSSFGSGFHTAVACAAAIFVAAAALTAINLRATALHHAGDPE
jgi:DHA2 family methylenomycin A resistance protein-like MFS transporter